MGDISKPEKMIQYKKEDRAEQIDNFKSAKNILCQMIWINLKLEK